MAYEAKTNWLLDDTVMPSDMNRIEKGIKDLDNKVTEIDGEFVTQTEMEEYAQQKGTTPTYESKTLSGEIIETEVPLTMESNLHISGNSEQEKKTLPSGFQGVEYIESTGTQYIDTGYSNASDSINVYDISFSYTVLKSSSTMTLFGGSDLQGSTVINRIGMICGRTDGKTYIAFGSTISSNSPYYYTTTLDKIDMRIHVDNNSNQYTIEKDSVLSSIYDITGSSKASSNMLLFANRSASGIFEYSQARVYYLKIYADGKLVKDMIPCYRKSDDVVGMYDLKNDTFYTNLGTGEFSKGNDSSIIVNSPSPDYPSEIRSVKSKSDNLITYPYDSKTFTLDGITFTDNGDGTINVNGTSTADCWFSFRTASKPLTLPKGTYTISGFEALNEVSKSGWSLGCTGFGFSKRFDEKRTFALTEETSSNIQLKIVRGYTFNNVTIKPMLNKGDKALPYQPYGYVPVEAKVEGKNLLNVISAYNALNHNSETEEYTIKSGFVNSAFMTVDMKLRANKTYLFEVFLSNKIANNKSLMFVFMNEKGSRIFTNSFEFKSSSNYYSYTYTPSEDATCTRIQLYTGTAFVEDVTFKLQVRESTTEEGYYSSKPNIVSLPLGDIELRSTPDGTRDTFARVDGVWNKVERIYSEVLDDAKTISKVSNNNAIHDYYFTAPISMMAKYIDKDSVIGAIRSTHFKPVINEIMYLSSGCMSLSASKNKVAFFINEEITTVEQCKAWLSVNLPEVIYELGTPIYTPITDTELIQALDELEQLVLHKGYNRITVTSVNGVKAYLDLEIHPTASVTKIEETESTVDMIIPVVSGEGDVIPKIPKANQMTLNPSTGLVKVKGLEIDGQKSDGIKILEASTENVIDFNTLTEEGIYLIKNCSDSAGTTLNSSNTTSNKTDIVLSVTNYIPANPDSTNMVFQRVFGNGKVSTPDKYRTHYTTGNTWTEWVQGYMDASHISGGTFRGNVTAEDDTTIDGIGISRVRNISAGTKDIEVGSNLTSGSIYLVYE